MSQPDRERADNVSRIARRVLLSLVTGTLAYFITNLLDQTEIWSITVSVFISGVVLVIQFLIDVEKRLKSVQDGHASHANTIEELVEEKFSKINEATELFGLVEKSAIRNDLVTQLVRNSTHLTNDCLPLVADFAQGEIFRISELLKKLGEGGDLTYDGEDRDWMLGLARNARSSINAISLTTVDSGGKSFIDGGLWRSDLGQRYLEVQRDAIRRGVKIRRLFVIDRPTLLNDPDVRNVCYDQAGIGIAVRILDPSAIPGMARGSLFDFILFDNVLSYESTPGSWVDDVTKPIIVNTHLYLEAVRVADRIQRFDDLWGMGKDLPIPPA